MPVSTDKTLPIGIALSGFQPAWRQRIWQNEFCQTQRFGSFNILGIYASSQQSGMWHKADLMWSFLNAYTQAKIPQIAVYLHQWDSAVQHSLVLVSPCMEAEKLTSRAKQQTAWILWTLIYSVFTQVPREIDK